MITETDLITNCLNGNESAWENFQLRYNRLIYHIASSSKWGFSSQDIEDICMDVYIRLIEYGLKNFKHDSSLSTYIGTITQRICIDKIREKRSKERQTVSFEYFKIMGRSLDQIIESRINIAENIVRKQTVEEINEIIEGMNDKCKEVLKLRYRERLAYDQIAKFLGKPISTVGSILSRCTNALINKTRHLIREI